MSDWLNSTDQTSVFGICCTSSKIKLPKLKDLPVKILNLLSDQDYISKQFHENIKKYNNALAITLLGYKVNRSVNCNSTESYVFKMHGQLSHKAGSLLSNNGQTPLYS